MRRFTARPGVVEVYDTGPVPAALTAIARETGGLSRRFRPALLWASGRATPYVAVWATDGEVPDLTIRRPGVEADLAGMRLARIRVHTCAECGSRFRGVFPGGSFAFRLPGGFTHPEVDECPVCESEAACLGFLGLIGPA